MYYLTSFDQAHGSGRLAAQSRRPTMALQRVGDRPIFKRPHYHAGYLVRVIEALRSGERPIQSTLRAKEGC